MYKCPRTTIDKQNLCYVGPVFLRLVHNILRYNNNVTRHYATPCFPHKTYRQWQHQPSIDLLDMLCTVRL
jgi:hypothetical protein